MKVLVTGANGFIAKNLLTRLEEVGGFNTVQFSRDTPVEKLPELTADVDAVMHLAGVNRPQDNEEFAIGNTDLTIKLCESLMRHGRSVPVIFASSTQVSRDNPYGRSKAAAEKVLWSYAESVGTDAYVYRLPNVFGKWCKPNYNSAVATFCYNIARGLPVTVHDRNVELSLVYIDDVIDEFLRVLQTQPSIKPQFICQIPIEYNASLGEITDTLEAFCKSRNTLISERVGVGFVRALYSTYVSYLPTEAFSYQVPQYGDDRGVFVEMLKTPDVGQFSFFTAHPGVTRGGHYHHTKTEKFLVVKGEARFGFRHILTGETYELLTNGDQAKIVETVPGWSHDITNIGDNEMVVMLWANEIFDQSRPDTFTHPV